ncbi:MAG TPA: Gfo/Idh/MocA family oxidoreductase [Solirubrobacteraceae bacterium]|jgi:predicted dehydrogenase|nr:Gfo/Idh/MocA family oxidoreductase [Solirubrobacteraceae bacterium]
MPEPSEILRVGVAGYGSTGQIRRRYVDAHPRMQTVAVCDRTITTPGASDDGVRMWSDWEQLLEEELDVLFVCLWNDIAPTVVMEGLKRGLHVFCEKPPGRTVQDIVQVREVERANSHLKLKYGFNHRYHESVRDALKIVQGGALGAVVDLRGVYGKSKMIRFDQDWRTKREIAGGGILLDQGIHMVDMMRLFAGEFVDIHSHVSNAFWCHDVEDNAYALMRTADGVVAMLHSSATQWRHRFGLDITLQEGALSLSGILSSSRSYGAETLTVVYRGEDDLGDPREVTTRYNDDHSWRDEIEEFARAIIANREIRHGSSLEALKTMQLVYDIYAADREWAERWLAPAPVGAAA